MGLHRAPAASVAQPWVIWHPLHTLMRQPDVVPAFMSQTLPWYSPARGDPGLQPVYTNLEL